MQKNLLIVAVLLLCSSVFFSCDPDPEEQAIIPKPRAYPLITFPEHKYKVHDSLCPYAFETPVYSVVLADKGGNSEPCWINIVYPQFKAALHVSYKVVDNNLDQYLQDSREFAMKHVVKANGLEENPVIRDSAKVYGLMYDIKGNAASNLQFYLTDSTKHFLRGSLYFNVAPNIDSLEPVINFLKEDIIHLIQTFEWQESSLQLEVKGKLRDVKKRE